MSSGSLIEAKKRKDWFGVGEILQHMAKVRILIKSSFTNTVGLGSMRLTCKILLTSEK